MVVWLGFFMDTVLFTGKIYSFYSRDTESNALFRLVLEICKFRHYGVWFLTFWLIFDCLKLLNIAKSRFLIVLMTFLGTPLFYYIFVIPCSSHGTSVFAVSLFLWYWFKSFSYPDKPGRYILLGIFAGIMVMVRPQEGLFMVCVLIEWTYRFFKHKDFMNILKQVGVFIVFFIITLSPQLLIWKFIYGNFLASPAGFNVSLNNFALKEVLFSSYHGILFWTPVYFIAFAGLLYSLKKDLVVYGSLLITVCLQVLINSLCVAFWEGHSFGLRQMTSSSLVIAVGIAGLWYKKPFLSLIVIPVIWTTLLHFNAYLGLDLLNYLSPEEIFNKQKNFLPVTINFFKQLFTKSQPGPSLSIGFFILTMAVLWIGKKIRERIDKKQLTPVIVILLIIICLFDIKIFRAHRNKPNYDKSGIQTIDSKQLPVFFTKQVEEMKDKYESLRRKSE